MAAQIGLHSHSCTLVRSWSRHQTVRKVDDSFAHSPLIAPRDTYCAARVSGMPTAPRCAGPWAGWRRRTRLIVATRSVATLLLVVSFNVRVHYQGRLELTTCSGWQASGLHERPPYERDSAPVLTLCTTGVPYVHPHERGTHGNQGATG